MRVIKPNEYTIDKPKFSIFLAGTIDNGSSYDWQSELCSELNKLGYDLTVFNPRRDNWDENATKEEMMNQIQWEQDHLEEADIIVMVLLSGSKSPISLMELGQFSKSGKMIVFCAPDFYRRTNVEWICKNNKILLTMVTDPKTIAKEINNILDIMETITTEYKNYGNNN